jgi:hypothetical protein
MLKPPLERLGTDTELDGILQGRGIWATIFARIAESTRQMPRPYRQIVALIEFITFLRITGEQQRKN